MGTVYHRVIILTGGEGALPPDQEVVMLKPHDTKRARKCKKRSSFDTS